MSRRGERLEERKLRNHALIVHERPRLCGLCSKGVRVGSGLCKPEIDELEHRFQIFARTGAIQSLFELTNERRCRGHFTGQHLAEIDSAELGDTSGIYYLRRRARGNVIRITHEGRSAR